MCLQQGIFSGSHKHALVRSRLKKSSLDPLDIKSFRPNSNLSFLSKVAERLVVDRFNKHADLYHLLPPRQSTYWQDHSTETAITIVHNDIDRAIDAGEVSVLVLLDPSAAFDTVDHDVLPKRFGVKCCALDWFRSYLSNRTQSFCVTSGQSAPVCSAMLQNRSAWAYRIHGGYRRNNSSFLAKPSLRRRHAAPKELT